MGVALLGGGLAPLASAPARWADRAAYLRIRDDRPGTITSARVEENNRRRLRRNATYVVRVAVDDEPEPFEVRLPEPWSVWDRVGNGTPVGVVLWDGKPARITARGEPAETEHSPHLRALHWTVYPLVVVAWGAFATCYAVALARANGGRWRGYVRLRRWSRGLATVAGAAAGATAVGLLLGGFRTYEPRVLVPVALLLPAVGAAVAVLRTRRARDADAAGPPERTA